MESLAVTTPVDKRKHRRLSIRLPIEYFNQESSKSFSGHSHTIDVCTGGVFFETTDDAISTGDLLSIEISMATENKRFPQNSKILTNAKIVRSTQIAPTKKTDNPTLERYGIAAQFTSDFKLSV